MKVSVVICTWNRSELLRRTLARLTSLEIPDGVEWELLLVDNASTDQTPSVAREFEGALPLRYLLEPRQGLAHARNAGLEAATGDLLLFTDDDVLADPRWLAEHVEAARRFPDAAFFGGTIEPWFEREPPRWISRHLDRLHGVYAIRRLGEEARVLAEDEYPYGANIGFRRRALRGGDFDVGLGRRGGEMLSGEETALLGALRRGGATGIWVGRARVRHFIPAQRATLDYVWSFFHGLGRTRARQGDWALGRSVRGIPLWAVRQYVASRLRSLLRSPFRDEPWLSAFRDAAIMRGLLDEIRSMPPEGRDPSSLRPRADAEGAVTSEWSPDDAARSPDSV